tara:strand:+ start:1338 stop:1961 length:624 start_codon:yes stop_codon:yes gene_type:complete
VQVLFGGTFDPVHDGHVAMVDQLRVSFPSAAIHVIPNNRPPHRNSEVSATHRLEMVHLAMGHIQGIEINKIEVERSGPSYTIDTLNILRKQFGNDESFVLVLGADTIRKMDMWYKPMTVPLLCNVCILNRAGERIGIPSVLSNMNEIVDGALLDNLPSGNLIRLQTPDLFVSSTLVRGLIARGAKQLPIPPNVADYIVKHDLYQDPE